MYIRNQPTYDAGLSVDVQLLWCLWNPVPGLHVTAAAALCAVAYVSNLQAGFASCMMRLLSGFWYTRHAIGVECWLVQQHHESPRRANQSTSNGVEPVVGTGDKNGEHLGSQIGEYYSTPSQMLYCCRSINLKPHYLHLCLGSALLFIFAAT